MYNETGGLVNNTVMRKSILLVLVWLLATPQVGVTCGKEGLFEFGMFSQTVSQQKRADGGLIWSEHYGRSVTTSKQAITIDLSFLEELRQNPTGEELINNREELIYLIGSGSEEATDVGLQVLIHLLDNPKYGYECGKHELYGKEEIAFNIGRTGKVFDALCRLKQQDRSKVLAYYQEYPQLWGMVYDPPWGEGNLDCEAYNN